ncbi:Respiratory supercomplex factor 1, mitochondrial [Exophiala dermatitidis]
MSNSNPFPPSSTSNEPSPLSSSPVPSSFDTEPEFFEESRSQKLWRKLRQEPLIPLGCAATCYALYMASKSMRAGDHHQTNRMFRARIYAQGFTLLALVAGSIFYKDERIKRKAFEAALEEKKNAEKRDRWLKELEARDREDQEWRAKIQASTKLGADRANLEDTVDKVKDTVDKAKNVDRELSQVEAEQSPSSTNKNKSSWQFWNKSVREEVTAQGWGPGSWAKRTGDAWRRF